MAEADIQEQRMDINYFKAVSDKFKIGYEGLSRNGDGLEGLGSYLSSSLKPTLDDLSTGLHEEDSKVFEQLHSIYKSNVDASERLILKYTNLEDLVEKVLSESIKLDENTSRDIVTSYNSILNGAVMLYYFLDPNRVLPLKGTKIKNLKDIYFQVAKIKGVDLIPVFQKGLNILQEYFGVTEQLVEQYMKKLEEAQQQQPQPTS